MNEISWFKQGVRLNKSRGQYSAYVHVFRGFLVTNRSIKLSEFDTIWDLSITLSGKMQRELPEILK